jgi:hypothetical protein
MGHLGAAPAPGALVLFDGTGLHGWRAREGGPARWAIAGEALEVVAGAGDIVTAQRFADCQLHIEFRCPPVAHAPEQGRGNSGIYLQGRYEIQVLDSYGFDAPGTGACGAVYGQHAPLLNASRAAGEWQSFDAVFRMARTRDGRVHEPARLTLLHNGVAVLNNVALAGPTRGALDEAEGEPGPLRLQEHGDAVAYRNIWLLPLPLDASTDYESR